MPGLGERLPSFKYHPDPVATGSLRQSDATCKVCGRIRGLIYTGPVFAKEELRGEVCPWCIADGSGAAKYDASFTDVGWGVPEGIPTRVTEELSRRTPGFSGWQQEHWLYHCRDAAAFLGPVGAAELARYPDAVEMLAHENDEFGWPQEQVHKYLQRLDRDGSPTAYLFQCLLCRQHLAYSDSD